MECIDFDREVALILIENQTFARIYIYIYTYIHIHIYIYIYWLDDLNIDLDLEGSLILIENQTFDCGHMGWMTFFYPSVLRRDRSG